MANAVGVRPETAMAAETQGCPDPQRHARVRLIPTVPSGRHDYVSSARMSLDEFLNLDQETGLAEWVDGEVFFYMSATSPHQRVTGFLFWIFTNVVALPGLGSVWQGPYALVTDRRRAGREPDVFVVSEVHQVRVTDRFLDGIPDLVVEVVSDDSVERDYVTKFREYEADGIPEYWIIDPREGNERADFYVLVDGRYVAAQPAPDGVYRSTAFPDVAIKVAWLFEAKPPLAEARNAELGRS